jgi:hypothetical protein
MIHSSASVPCRFVRGIISVGLAIWMAMLTVPAYPKAAEAAPEQSKSAARGAARVDSEEPLRHSFHEKAAIAAEVRSAEVEPFDLILIVDCSRSMIGKGGPRNIFPEVKAAGQDLVDWVPAGGSVVLVAYDESVRLLPAIAIYGDRERDFAKNAIDQLFADGRFTFTSKAVAEALEEAHRLHSAQLGRQETPRRKLIILLTDGLDDPPPHAVGNSRVALADVARQFGEMPWFVWQVQFGTEIDRQVDSALRPHLPGYEARRVQDLGELRSTIVPEIAASATKTWEVAVEPAVLDLGSIEPGTRHQVLLRLRGDVSAPDASISIRPGIAPAGIAVNPAAEAVALRLGVAEVQISLVVEGSAPEGRIEGSVTLDTLTPGIRLTSATVNWRATIARDPGRVVVVEPASSDLGTVRLGELGEATLTVLTRGSTGRVRLRTAQPLPGILVTTAPEVFDVTSSATEVQVRVEVTPEATVNASNVVRLVADVVSGNLTTDDAVGELSFATAPPWSWAPIVYGGLVAIAGLALVGLVTWHIRRPRLEGQLRHWTDSSSATSVDLGRFGTRTIRVSSEAGSEISIPELGDSSVTIEPVRRAGRVFATLMPATGTIVQRIGKQVSGLDLHDGDEFAIRGVRFRYRGNVPARVGQK